MWYSRLKVLCESLIPTSLNQERAYCRLPGAVRNTASSYAAIHMVTGSRPVFVIAWEWHIDLALLCGCSGALEYPTTNSCRPINKSLILILIVKWMETVAYSSTMASLTLERDLPIVLWAEHQPNSMDLNELPVARNLRVMAIFRPGSCVVASGWLHACCLVLCKHEGSSIYPEYFEQPTATRPG